MKNVFNVTFTKDIPCIKIYSSEYQDNSLLGNYTPKDKPFQSMLEANEYVISNVKWSPEIGLFLFDLFDDEGYIASYIVEQDIMINYCSYEFEQFLKDKLNNYNEKI